MTDSWEERMAAKAAQRRAIAEAQWEQESRIDWEAQQQAWTDELTEETSPEEAQEYLDFLKDWNVGCACIGGKSCCMLRATAARRVLGIE